MDNKEKTAEILIKVAEKLPDDFPNLSPELQMHHLVLVSNDILGLEGHYILLDSTLTLKELLKAPD